MRRRIKRNLKYIFSVCALISLGWGAWSVFIKGANNARFLESCSNPMIASLANMVVDCDALLLEQQIGWGAIVVGVIVLFLVRSFR